MANEKTEIEKLNLNSMNIAEEKQNELLRLFPEIRTEGGKIDFEKLKLALGQVTDTGKERYGMNWPGKAECFKTLSTPSMGTLSPLREKSLEFDESQNLFIEGDNLEVLKLLQKAYLGKIKFIYIDPPYNTGNDFIYPDNYSESLQTYLQYTGQVDPEGKKFGTNVDTDGRFHSKWLNLMYTRLYVARNLLRDDGVIMISMGQSEIASLVLLVNEIFGEENRVSICTRMMKSGGQKGKFFSPNTDYVVVVAKNISALANFRGELSEELISKVYNQVQHSGPRKGQNYRSMGLYQPSLDERPNQRYYIQCPDGSLVIPPGQTFPSVKKHLEKIRPQQGDGVWRWTADRLEAELKEDNVEFKETETSPLLDQAGKKSKWNIYTKIWLNDRMDDGALPLDLFDKFENRHSAQELNALGIEFDFAKPTELISYLMMISNVEDGDYVLDFFGGSGSTAHAALKLNSKDGANRHFILVQLPEPIEPSSPMFEKGCKTISDIAIERIRKSVIALNEDKNEKKLDRGFKVFKLTDSNFKEWSQDTSKEALEKQLELHVDHVKHERTADDILYEILLKSGFPLTTKVETQKFGKQTVYSIAGGMLLVCLEDNLTLDLIKHIAEQKPERVVCLDQGFANNDQLKANAVQIFRTKGIAKFQTV